MGTMSKSPGKMVHDFCIQAKVEDATIYLAGHGCPKYDCGQKRWFHEKLRYFSSSFRRMTQLTQRTQRPLRNASSLNPASTIAFVIALAAKTRMGGMRREECQCHRWNPKDQQRLDGRF